METKEVVVILVVILAMVAPFIRSVLKQMNKPKKCTCGGFLIHDEKSERVINPKDYCPIHKNK